MGNERRHTVFLEVEKYYNVAFDTGDHQPLAELLKNIKGRFILPYNDDAFIKQPYA